MKINKRHNLSSSSRLEKRLLVLVFVFLFLFSSILTLSPAVRLHSWSVEYRWTHWIGFGLWLLGFFTLHKLLKGYTIDRDPLLLPLAAMLSGWGLLSIWRLNPSFGLRQAIWLLISLAAVYSIQFLPNSLVLLQRYKTLWLTSGVVLTVLTFFFGTYPAGDGPHLWLGCCGVYLQPSEPLRLFLLVYLAGYLADRIAFVSDISQLIFPTSIITGIALVLLIVQRDLGTASSLVIVYFLLIYLAIGRRRILIALGIVILIGGILGYLSFDVIQLRFSAWLNPWLDPSGRSYQIVQSLMALASGQLIGRGPGLGSPGLIPVSHSDFIFAAISEEMGLFGSLGIILMVALLISRGLTIAMRAPKLFHRLLAAGLTIHLGVQSIMIIGGNTRLLPLTGVTLPFVSYGGSSLLSSFFALGLLLRISDQADHDPLPMVKPKAYPFALALLLSILALTALITGWWATVRAENLQGRTDNQRLIINDRYSKRGNIYDRNNLLIAHTSGSPGVYLRQIDYPELSPTIGYINAVYGQTGLEKSLDPILRGLQGRPASEVLFAQLLYGQPPPGMNIRLTIDLRLQKIADRYMKNRKGGLVLLNAKSGEVLAISSHPNFNANQINEMGATWSEDPYSPLFNRATLGQYPPGLTITPFMLAHSLVSGEIPDNPEKYVVNYSGDLWNCSHIQQLEDSLESQVINGCPTASLALGNSINEDELLELYRGLGLFSSPEFSLPTAGSAPEILSNSKYDASLGKGQLHTSPLQMALAASVLSWDGTLPAPRIALSFESPNEGWLIFPTGSPAEVLPVYSVRATTGLLRHTNQPIWQHVSTVQRDKDTITWFIGGTIFDWEGTPLALALVLEEENPHLAYYIGVTLLNSAMFSQ